MLAEAWCVGINGVYQVAVGYQSRQSVTGATVERDKNCKGDVSRVSAKREDTTVSDKVSPTLDDGKRPSGGRMVASPVKEFKLCILATKAEPGESRYHAKIEGTAQEKTFGRRTLDRYLDTTSFIRELASKYEGGLLNGRAVRCYWVASASKASILGR